MKHKKIASILAITVLSLTVPFFSIPRAHAFDDNIQYAMAGFQTYSDPLFGTLPTAREGSTVTLTVIIDASDFGTGQQNVTVGLKPSWTTTWTNATNADTDSTLAITRNQVVSVTVSLALPTLTGAFANFNLQTHSWQARVWTGALNAPSTSFHDQSATTTFALYSNDQADGLAAREQANERISYLTPVLGFGFAPGQAKAASDLAQAQAERDLGNTNYAARNFAAARANYQNALNLANSAASALSGGDAATFTNVLLGGIGIFLLGVGVFIAGFGGFWYALRRPKMKVA